MVDVLEVVQLISSSSFLLAFQGAFRLYVVMPKIFEYFFLYFRENSQNVQN